MKTVLKNWNRALSGRFFFSPEGEDIKIKRGVSPFFLPPPVYLPPSNKRKLNFTTIWIENWCGHPIGLHNFCKGPLKEPACKFDPKPQKLEYKKVAKPSFQQERNWENISTFPSRNLQHSEEKRLRYRVETAGPVVATATVATTMFVKAPDYRKDMLVRAKIQFEGFDNATQPKKNTLGVRAACLCFSLRVWNSRPKYQRIK